MTAPNRFMTAVYLIAIAIAWAMLSTMDYQDARREECQARSNARWTVTYDVESDTCKKEANHGTTKKD